MGLENPNWCTEDIKKNLKEIYEIEKDIECYDERLKRWTGGLWIRTFLKNVEEKKRKMFLYGGHDFNIAHLQRTLGIQKYLGYPHYSSAIIFEKYQDSKRNEFIRVRIII